VRRADTPRRAVTAVSVAAVLLGLLFPVFGVSLLVVLGLEAILARRDRTREAVAEEEVPVGSMR
jgi:uncharacterized iron-regulated membrane protein